ncbi:MAG TPA: sugar ABC transporter permease, partial [Deinococcales bacterium]|nr:sugar ABC transporter permease [Deinococcales bacterium]
MTDRSLVASARPGGSHRNRLLRYEARMGFVFISPAMILFLIFTVLPLIGALVLSFTNYDIISRAQWVGLANYTRLLTDDLFQRGLQNVLYYVVMYVPCMVGISLLLALALNRPVPGMKIYRTIYYLPMISSSVAASIFWSWMLQKDYGALNQILALVGINGPAWLQNTDTAMIAIVLVTVWQGLGGNMIIYLAGLQGVPKYLYEAALIDGASSWQQFRYITWPVLRPTTFFVTIMALIGS